MAEDRQPASLVEGAGTGDLEDELPDAAAKSAEDRKAAAALAKLDDTRGDDDDARGADAADREAASKAVQGLGGKAAPAAEVKKVKVDAADVALLVDELDLAKPKATELLKAHDGDAVRAMRAFVKTR